MPSDSLLEEFSRPSSGLAGPSILSGGRAPACHAHQKLFSFRLPDRPASPISSKRHRTSEPARAELTVARVSRGGGGGGRKETAFVGRMIGFRPPMAMAAHGMRVVCTSWGLTIF